MIAPARRRDDFLFTRKGFGGARQRQPDRYSISDTTRYPTARAKAVPIDLRRGARVVFELIEELHHHQDLGDDLDRRLERYAGLDPELVRVLGADRFTQAPLHTIAGGRR